jgi:hypothetical protein
MTFSTFFPVSRIDGLSLVDELRAEHPGQGHDDAERPVPLVSSEGSQGLGGDLEQQAVSYLRVAASEGNRGVGQGEDEVEVLDGEQFQFPGIDPCAALAAAAFGTYSAMSSPSSHSASGR